MVRFNRDTLADLKSIIVTPRAPCEGSRWNSIRHDWWYENGWHWPKWGVDLYGEDGKGGEEYLFTLNNIGFIDSLIVPRVVKWSDREIRTHRFYWWS